MNIEGLGEKSIIQLVEKGLIQKVSDLYGITLEQLLNLEGFAEKSASNLLKSINISKSTSLNKFIYSLGIREVGKNEFYMDASIAIDDIALSIGVSFEGEGFDTIGGFVLHELGKIPSPGDTFSYNNLSIEVISTVGRRLREIKILKT